MGKANRLKFGDGKISVGNATQDGIPILMFELMEKAIPVGNTTHRKAGEVIPAEEVDSKMMVMEFHNKESVLVVLEQLMSVYFACLDKERKEGRICECCGEII